MFTILLLVLAQGSYSYGNGTVATTSQTIGSYDSLQMCNAIASKLKEKWEHNTAEVFVTARCVQTK